MQGWWFFKDLIDFSLNNLQRETNFNVVVDEGVHSRLVQANCSLAVVKEYKVLRLVRNKSSEVATNDAMPSRTISIIKVRFYVFRNIFLLSYSLI